MFAYFFLLFGFYHKFFVRQTEQGGNNGYTPDDVNNVMHQIGYFGYQGISRAVGDNVYTDKSGNNITREEFWNNFDAENGTKILPRDQWKF